MAHYIDKSTLIAEIDRRIASLESIGSENYLHDNCPEQYAMLVTLKSLKFSIDTLKVKTDEDNSLEKFKSLQHISGNLHQTLEDWGYAPNLYFFDGMWHVSWISCSEGDGIKDFEGNTPEEAIDKAYNWFHSTFCNN